MGWMDRSVIWNRNITVITQTDSREKQDEFSSRSRKAHWHNVLFSQGGWKANGNIMTSWDIKGGAFIGRVRLFLLDQHLRGG